MPLNSTLQMTYSELNNRTKHIIITNNLVESMNKIVCKTVQNSIAIGQVVIQQTEYGEL
jgi:hypothetical protein